MNSEHPADMSLSVVVPALNEEDNIRLVIDELVSAVQSAVADWEVILIDDGSTDRTGEMADEMGAEQARIRVVHHERPHGFGASLAEGFLTSAKAAVTWIPADCENDPGELLKYLPLIEHVDIIIPYVTTPEVRRFHRRMLSALFVRIINATFGTRFNSTNTTSIYRRAVFDVVKPRSTGFLINAETLVKAVKAGFNFADVPVGLRKRSQGDSKALSARSILNLMWEFLRLVAWVYLPAAGAEAKEGTTPRT